MSNPSVSVSENSLHYSRSEFYNSLSRQCILEEKKVFKILKRIVEEEASTGLQLNEGRLEYIEYLTKLTNEYNTLAIGFRKISTASFS